MLKLKILLFALLCFAVLPAKAIYPKASHMLDSLDRYIANRSTIHEKKIAEITAKSKLINKTAHDCRQLPQYAQVVDAYLHVDADSALHYAELAIALCKQCNDTANLSLFRIKRCHALTNRGDVYLATVAYENIPPHSIATKDRPEYFEVGFNVYSRAFIYLRKDEEQRYNPFESRVKAALDSLNALTLSDKTKTRFYNDLNIIHSSGPQVDGVADVIDMLTYSTPGTYQYGHMAVEIAHYYVKEGQNDLAKYYFTAAAISDIKGDINETEALHGLGLLLHSEGNIDHANKYLQIALDNALQDGDQAAAMQIAKSLKTLLDDVNNSANRSHRSNILTTVIAAVLLILVICLAVYFKNKHNTNKRRNTNMRQKHRNKNVYIRKLLTLVSLEMNALEDYNRLVARKIKAMQVHDLLQLSESGKVVEEQLQNFQSEFDSSFLATHPHFIEQVNELLQEDKKYAPLPGGTLNTELRYLAFMSLGVDDYQQIAVFLGITQSSAYTYKNKLKSKALDRENFEENIAKLD